MNTKHQTIQNAISRIAPAWPLKNLVAVNPYLGFTGQSLDKSTHLLSQIDSIQTTMSLEYYIKQLRNKKITLESIEKALQINEIDLTAIEFIQLCDDSIRAKSNTDEHKIKTIADIAGDLSETSWNDFLRNKQSNWNAAYFDEFQASWSSLDQSNSLFDSWKSEVEIDRSYRIAGLSKFSTTIKNLPKDEDIALEFLLKSLDISDEYLEYYSTRLLYNLNGWSSYIAGIDWNNNLYEAKTNHLRSFLLILIATEYALYESLKTEKLIQEWKKAQSIPSMQNEVLRYQYIFQEALDITYQDKLTTDLQKPKGSGVDIRPKLQAVFCIDVRSEVMRRHLEAQDEQYETKGYAGFFGVPVKYAPLGAENNKNLCPVLLPSGPLVRETTQVGNVAQIEQKKIRRHQLFRSFKAFKSGPVSSFGFVSPLGLAYLPKLVGDALGYTRPVANPDKLGHTRRSWSGRNVDLSGIDFETKVNMAEGTIKSMGFDGRFAPVILITGHGSTSVNNPHAAGLECGACGGHAGDINARSTSAILNDIAVRKALHEKGIEIPNDTVFVPCLHNTTTDEIEILDKAILFEKQPNFIEEIETKLAKASSATRKERSLRLGINAEKVEKSIFKRSKDWSQIRPEWGLAGCSSFIIADRKNTRGVDLEGKSFLHDYNWKTDESATLLESIMTAPMVVTSWINLQYYGSTVDPKHFGAGNKTLHNVTGGIGVLEGSAGDLRIGFPLQSIHNGSDFEHTPQRLSVVIQAPTTQINIVLAKHQNVKELFDNRWIHLLVMNDKGMIISRYDGGLKWESIGSQFQEILEKEKDLVTI